MNPIKSISKISASKSCLESRPDRKQMAIYPFPFSLLFKIFIFVTYNKDNKTIDTMHTHDRGILLGVTECRHGHEKQQTRSLK